jgi:carbamoyl-phosphate synthase large subunit
MGPNTISSKGRRSDAIVRLLLTCLGRRVELVRAFRQAAEKLGIELEIHGADSSRLSPAIHMVDRAHFVPTIASGGYIDALERIVKRSGINLLIPLIDSELPDIAAARNRFADLGCLALISSPRVVQTCRDKLAMFDALRQAEIDTPETWTWDEALRRKRRRFPYYLKPRAGSAAMGNYIVRDADELRVFGQRVKEPIVQEFVEGSEYTLDVYTGLDGRPRCVVPRLRLEVRSGEVSKGRIVKDRAIMTVGRRVVEMLGECRGVVTVQCIVTPDRKIRVIEVNPRFGGGAPLSIHAGADFPKWILQELLGSRPRINPTGFRDDVAMLHYDDSVFLLNASKNPRLDSRKKNSRPPRPQGVKKHGTS